MGDAFRRTPDSHRDWLARVACHDSEQDLLTVWNNLLKDVAAAWSALGAGTGEILEVKKKLEAMRQSLKWYGPPPQDLVRQGLYHTLGEIFRTMASGSECQNMALEIIALTVNYYPASITTFMELKLTRDMRTFLEYRKTMSPKMQELFPYYFSAIVRELANTEHGVLIVLEQPAGHVSFFEHCLVILEELWAGPGQVTVESVICEILRNVAQWVSVDLCFFGKAMEVYERGLSEQREVSSCIGRCLEFLWSSRVDQRDVICNNAVFLEWLVSVVNEGIEEESLIPALVLVREIGKGKRELLSEVRPHSLCFLADKYANENDDSRTDDALFLLGDVVRALGNVFDLEALVEFLNAQVGDPDIRYTRKSSVAYMILSIVSVYGLVHIPAFELVECAFDWAPCGSSELIDVGLEAALTILSRCEPDDAISRCIFDFLVAVQAEDEEKARVLLEGYFSETVSQC